MVGTTAQLVALTCRLNALRRGLPVEQFFLGHSTARFCRSIEYMRPKRRLIPWTTRKWVVVDPTPDAWCSRLIAEGFQRACLFHTSGRKIGLSDRMTAGLVGGGGRWMLGVLWQSTADLWEAAWNVAEPDAPDHRIWSVQYGLVAERSAIAAPPEEDCGGLVSELDAALAAIEEFAFQNDLPSFGQAFRKGRDCLAASDPLSLVYHPDLVPSGLLGLAARQLLAAAQAAWVFGGMGSWNDLWFEGEIQAAYDRLSENLFRLLNRSICCAANSPVAD